ncbi:hypothetical protein GR170_08890 [Pseudooceanicola sp. GBMRC 2024]|uniref:DUF3830 family protein n=1 Tax=Pseudooceanicola albus TaxID=2692189 RepID=A0A6L7G3K7_9RHOB|nr:hypothetical protein [Pseudooceanicola albus]MXN17950.1 hypothetical protein [Pseudooceanicola albus]
MMDLTFEACGLRLPILPSEGAPRTLAALQRALPMPLQLHTPKIAGSHIFWHAPFVEDAEGGVDVLSARPGAFIYWPVRQFLEITFAPLQAETAQVTVLGHIDAPVAQVVELGQRLRQEAGRRRFTGRLTGTALPPPPAPAVPAGIHAARLKLWQACPEDIGALTRSRAIMHPVGPVMQAESEARVLHEMLWWIRAALAQQPEAALRITLAMALDKAAVRLRDFCHMGDTAAALFACSDAAADPTWALPALLDEAILIAGRIGAWIDLLIPWNDLNEGFRSALAAAEVPA